MWHFDVMFWVSRILSSSETAEASSWGYGTKKKRSSSWVSNNQAGSSVTRKKQKKGTRRQRADKSLSTKWQTAKTSAPFICSIIKHEIGWLTLDSGTVVRVPVHFRGPHPQSKWTCSNKDALFTHYNCFHVALKVDKNMFLSNWALKGAVGKILKRFFALNN